MNMVIQLQCYYHINVSFHLNNGNMIQILKMNNKKQLKIYYHKKELKYQYNGKVKKTHHGKIKMETHRPCYKL